MVLNWLHQGAVVDGSTFRPPKNLDMVATNVFAPPRQFRVYQVFNPASVALRRMLHQPVQRFVVGIPAERGRRGTYIAVNEWTLPTPTGYHFASRFIFKGDDAYEESGRIGSHRLGDFKFGVRAGATLEDPTRSVPIGTNGGGTLSADFRAAVDPILLARVLTGWELLHVLVQETLADLQSEGLDTEGRAFRASLDAALETLTPSFEYPRGWFYEVSPPKFTAEEGSVTRIDLEISADSVGRGLMAFQVVDGNNPREGAISEILHITAQAGGRLHAETATDFGGPGLLDVL